MHSPYEAVYGFDRTHIPRITLQEYMNENDIPNVGSLLQQGNGGRLLSSRDPDVQFCTKYPVYDRFGRELCVLYQILETEIRHEIRRVEQGGDVVRKSGVRLSAEIPLDDISEESSKLLQQQGGGGVYRPTPFVHAAFVSNERNGDEEGNDENNLTDVSASSHQLSSAMVLSSEGKGTGVRDTSGSCFSFYRDSGLNVHTKLLGNRDVNHHHYQQQQHQQPSDVVLGGIHSAPASQRIVCSNTNTSAQYSPTSDFALPQQCNNTAYLPRVGDNNGVGGVGEVKLEVIVGKEQEEEDSSHPARVTFDNNAGNNPLRFTTVRASELRTTKQLFASGCAMAVPRRTIKHPNLISCQAYGAQSKVILASLVAPLITANLEAVNSDGNFWNMDELTPQMEIGRVVVLGKCQYRILRYFDSSDVYEVREVETTETSASTQNLIYRWSVRAVQQGLNEAHRAALGLSLTAPFVTVAGYHYRDGGLTVITMPKGYNAVPLSTIPLSARSFPTCVKLLLRMLSDLVVKRTVHGNLRALNQVFLALRDREGAPDMPAALLVPVHWERLVDFSMFVDRNAGRIIPMEDDDISGRRGERVNHGQDVSMVITMLLENELAEHLRPEQLVEAQRLMMMTTEPTQVANYLIQLKNTMTVIPSDMISLQQEYEIALQCQC